MESLKARVQLIIDEEALMSESELQNPKNFPPFIQVLQAHRRPEPAWAGLGGKMALEVQKIDKRDLTYSKHVHLRVGTAGARGKTLPDECPRCPLLASALAPQVGARSSFDNCTRVVETDRRLTTRLPL